MTGLRKTFSDSKNGGIAPGVGMVGDKNQLQCVTRVSEDGQWLKQTCRQLFGRLSGVAGDTVLDECNGVSAK